MATIALTQCDPYYMKSLSKWDLPDYLTFERKTTPRSLGPREEVIPFVQKAVYLWFERRKHRETSEPIPIYHSTWEARIERWCDEVCDMYSTRRSPRALKKLEVNVNAEVTSGLDLRVLFFWDPVTACLLWEVLHAAYELDSAVCGPEAKAVLARWRKWKPFRYLRSEQVNKKWKTELIKLARLMRSGEVGEQDVVGRACDIYRAFGNLKEKVGLVMERLRDEEPEMVMRNELPGTTLGQSVREAVWQMYCSRCAVGAESLGPGDGSHDSASEGDMQDDDDRDDSSKASYMD